jgi:hypothetical protein
MALEAKMRDEVTIQVLTDKRLPDGQYSRLFPFDSPLGFLGLPGPGASFSVKGFFGVSLGREGAGREKWANVPFKPLAGSLND